MYVAKGASAEALGSSESHPIGYGVLKAAELLRKPGRTWSRKAKLPGWLFEAQLRGPARARRGELMDALRAINDLLIRRDEGAVDSALQMADVSQLSPELLVGLARVTAAVAVKLSSWKDFVIRVRDELNNRELPSDEMLKGLL